MSSKHRLGILVAALLGGVWSQAAAQELPQNIDITLFFPAASQGSLFALDTSAVTPARSFGAGITLGFALDPLKADIAGQEASLVTNLSQMHLYGTLGLGGGLELGALLPLTALYTQDLTPLGGVSSLEAGKLGDLRLRAKANLAPVEDGSLGLAVLTEVVLPTGSKAAALGVPKPEFSPTMVLEYLSGPLSIIANIGYTLRSTVSVGSATIDDRINLGGGLAYALSSSKTSRLSAILEAQANLPNNLGSGSQESETPVEARIGGRYLVNSLIFQFGLGRGLTEGIGAPSFRAFAGVAFTPNKADSDQDGIRDLEDSCPKNPEDMDNFEDEDGCPDDDNDQDGILDGADQCPVEAEDIDGFEDENGCPDDDNDQDTVPDLSDQCATEPEDLDNFEDEDGCPDPDNDQDGIPDGSDNCTEEKEDADGFEDEDGCPDPDNDQDGIPDVSDACLLEKEVVNEYQDDDGCPDEKPLAEVAPEKKQIVIYDQVYFATGKAKIEKSSFALLDEVAKLINENPDIQVVRIEGHTDDVGSDKTNLKLSDSRAKAVVTYLTKTGKVNAKRLFAKGYGKSCPLEEGTEEAIRTKNRRVEFVIMDEGEDPAGECRAKSRG